MFLGRRRGNQFLSLRAESGRPFFGLGNPYTLTMVEANIDDGIQHMREIATSLDLKDYEAFIMYCETCVDGVYYELATAIPHTRLSSKRLQDGFFKQERVHARWITSELCFASSTQPPCNCQNKCSSDCPCHCARVFCGKYCHSGVAAAGDIRSEESSSPAEQRCLQKEIKIYRLLLDLDGILLGCRAMRLVWHWLDMDVSLSGGDSERNITEKIRSRSSM